MDYFVYLMITNHVDGSPLPAGAAQALLQEAQSWGSMLWLDLNGWLNGKSDDTTRN